MCLNPCSALKSAENQCHGIGRQKLSLPGGRVFKCSSAFKGKGDWLLQSATMKPLLPKCLNRPTEWAHRTTRLKARVL